jgi:peptidoglycan/LPS O-acetylase OafA/YrhL
MILSVITRIGLLFVYSLDFSYINVRLLFGLDTRADSLLAGCAAGVLVASDLMPQWRGSRALTFSAILSVLGVLIIGCCEMTAPNTIKFGWPLASFFGAVLLIHLTLNPRTVLHSFLENPVLVFVGKISYGLYLWHYFILTVLEQHDLPSRYLTYLIPTVGFALLSYYFVEKPFLRLKQQFARAG